MADPTLLHQARGGTGFDDDVLGLNLRNQIRAEILANMVRDFSCHVTVQRTNGEIVQKTDGACFATPHQRAYAMDVARALNREVSFGGSWIVVWCEPAPVTREPARFLLLWKDADGDVPLTTDCIEGFDAMLRHCPAEVWCARAALRWKAYREWLIGMEISPGQMIRAAKGERSRDPTAIVPYSPI